MFNFTEKPVSKSSVTRRELVYGLGVNDANYITRRKIDGKQVTCPFYSKWHNMMQRCYNPKLHARYPTYLGCSVTNEWLIFSNFKKWMEKQDWTGMALDKDILEQGNKVYSPEKCIFVTNQINKLFIDRARARGAHKIGAHWDKIVKKFRAQCRVNGKRKFLGYFSTENEAHEAYKAFKYQLIRDTALAQKEPLKSALLNYVIQEY
tara:strand:- start:2039 stop:2656 length:618 start_codon:yes stop_codon:yes gene_type:complete